MVFSNSQVCSLPHVCQTHRIYGLKATSWLSIHQLLFVSLYSKTFLTKALQILIKNKSIYFNRVAQKTFEHWKLPIYLRSFIRLLFIVSCPTPLSSPAGSRLTLCKHTKSIKSRKGSTIECCSKCKEYLILFTGNLS